MLVALASGAGWVGLVAIQQFTVIPLSSRRDYETAAHQDAHEDEGWRPANGCSHFPYRDRDRPQQFGFAGIFSVRPPWPESPSTGAATLGTGGLCCFDLAPALGLTPATAWCRPGATCMKVSFGGCVQPCDRRRFGSGRAAATWPFRIGGVLAWRAALDWSTNCAGQNVVPAH